MPELPDIVVYIEALRDRILNEPLQRLRIVHPFLLRTAQPPAAAALNRRVRELRRIGKRIAVGFEDQLWFLVHLMVAGRLHWRKPDNVAAGKTDLALLEFPAGTLVLSEPGTRKQASLHCVQGDETLRSFDRGGVEVLQAGLDEFSAALTSENHTVKRALTDPRLFSGIGNAYSDEILFRARLSPAALTQKLGRSEIEALYRAVRETLTEWTERIRRESAGAFPEKVSAFRKDMAVHGRYRRACPICGSPIQRIRYAANESNYCARCQRRGRCWRTVPFPACSNRIGQGPSMSLRSATEKSKSARSQVRVNA